MDNSFGDFVVGVACGTERSRTMTVEQSDQVLHERCARVGPQIAALRQAQQEARRDEVRLDEEQRFGLTPLGACDPARTGGLDLAHAFVVGVIMNAGSGMFHHEGHMHVNAVGIEVSIVDQINGSDHLFIGEVLGQQF